MATATTNPQDAKDGGESNTGTNNSRFMFVEFSAPAAPVPKGTKKRRGGPSEVRAHITKEYHRRLRVKRLGAPRIIDDAESIVDGNDEEEQRMVLPERSRSGSRRLDSTTPLAGPDDRQDQTERTRRGSNSGTSRASSLSAASGSAVAVPPSPQNEITRSLSISPKLRNLLGEGRLDPFEALPSQGRPLFIHQVLDHALVHTWPNTVPVRSRTMMNPVQAAWFRCAMEHPIAFHSFIYATTLHMLDAHKGQEIVTNAPMLRLEHKTRTIALIKDTLAMQQDPHTPPSDALIMAIAILAIHGSRDPVIHPHVHPQSPLAEAQNLHVYGNMVNDESHVKWITYMIMQKGGLDGLELYGMADTMALCDVYFATKHVCTPSFPLRTQPESLVLSGKHVLDAISMELDSELSSGFKYFRFNPDGRELLSVLEAFSEVTVALDHYARGGPTAPDLIDLVTARHAAQHRLLSQLPSPQSNFLDGDKSVLHACRLATLIFSNMAIFPLPPTQGVKHRLAPLLRHTLQACSISCSWDLHAYVLLWATTLGAIAATYTFDRGWYVKQMIEHVENLGIDHWSTLNALCSKFLWWKPVCGEPAETLWAEMFPSFDDNT